MSASYSSEIKAIGIPMTEPTHDATRAHESLLSLQANYPSQIFMLEGWDQDNVVVSWVPIWLVDTALTTLLSNAIHSSYVATTWWSKP